MSFLQPLKYVVTVLCLGISLQSCIFQYDNCPPEGIMITNDWSQAPLATPEGMAYMFFSDEGGEPWRFDFPGPNGGSIDIPIGTYKFLSYNDDTYNVKFAERNGYEHYVAYTSDVDTRSRLPEKSNSNNEQLVECPDMMWGCAYRFVNIEHNKVEYGSILDSLQTSYKRILLCRQKQLTARYRYIIQNVKNLNGVRSLSCMFSGLAGALNLASGEKEKYPVRLPSTAGKKDSTTIVGEFITFGIPRNPDIDNFLSLMVILNDGRKYNYEFNVTEQVRESKNPLDVTVIINGLELEESEPVDVSGGFNANVDGWITVTININS